tara:strand:+ start:222 stop:515 length:294 start_codon:yes stop_codon:yes gene_type:complete
VKKEQEQKCTCNKAQSAHDKLNEDILEAVFDSMDDLEPPHVVFVGIHLFADIALGTCKDKEQAKEYVMNIVEEAFRHDEEEGYGNESEAAEAPNVVH